MSVHASSGTSYVRLSDVFNHDAAVRLHAGGMGGDVIHILKGSMNHMALIGIHWLTTLPFTSIRRLLQARIRAAAARGDLQFTSIRRLLRGSLKKVDVTMLLQFTSIRRLLPVNFCNFLTDDRLQFTSIHRLLLDQPDASG